MMILLALFCVCTVGSCGGHVGVDVSVSQGGTASVLSAVWGHMFLCVFSNTRDHFLIEYTFAMNVFPHPARFSQP